MVYKYIRNEAGEFVCPHCNVVKKNQNTMHYHMNKHEGDLPHECKHFKQRFLLPRILNLHISAKHADKDTETAERCECPHADCNYSSLTKANRRIHYFRVHMKDIIEKYITKNEETFSCKGCSKAMKSQTSLYYHLGDCIKIPETDARAKNIASILL